MWGFSIPKMLGIDRSPTVIDETMMPPEAYGVAVMSMDYFVKPDQAVIWRGPMLHKALEQFLVDVHWGEPDYLLIDMPPGTGDIAISMSQFLPRAQAIVVTTPSQPPSGWPRGPGSWPTRSIRRFSASSRTCRGSPETTDAGTRSSERGVAQQLADELDVPLLGQDPAGSRPCGKAPTPAYPVCVAAPDSAAAGAFRELAAAVEARKPRLRSHPELIIR